jgi:serine/threonine-protein kinase
MRQFGAFELEARLGRGGSAEVWRAALTGPRGFRKRVALKRLLPELSTDARVRELLLAEARLLSQLRHPNIASVLDVVEAAGEHAIVLEWVDGCDLRALVRALPSPPPPGLAVFVVHEVSRALAAAHAHRPPIVHRDVSARNVLLARSGAVKLGDFGVGKALAEADSDGRTASLRGNLGTMAPEQLARAPLSPATDVYGAGVLLWELLTGRRRFSAVFDLAEAARERSCPVAPPSSLNPRVPTALDALCARAIAFDPRARFADGAELAAALAPFVHQLGFGPMELARLVGRHAQAATEEPTPAPARRTVTVPAASPAIAAPAAARKRRTAPLAAAAALASLCASAWIATRANPMRPAAPPARVDRVGSVSRAPVAPLVEPTPAATRPRRRTLRAPSIAPSPARREPIATPEPDLVEGTLVNPFAQGASR